jgi:Fibronectin type III domain
VTIRQSDGTTYTADATNCNMASSTSTSCAIPVATLRASPYSLAWGASVYAKVAAKNIYGTSTASSEGNGGKIITSPGVPLNLANDASVTTATQIGLTWSAPTDDGGSIVIDYKIQIDSGSGYSDLVSGVTATSYTAVSLTQGTTYNFKIQSRNAYGFSAESTAVSILAAQIPA